MAPDLQNLILVAGHAIPHEFSRLEHDAGWHLKSFQSGEGKFYLEHVREGVLCAAADPQALLVFSGGQTDPAAGPVSEALGYWRIAHHHDWYGQPHVRHRATTEEFALDSFHNLLYGICRFHEMTHRYPQRVTVLGWRFKQARFDFHRASLRFPAERFSYLGVNDPELIDDARHHEALRLADFERDPYGATPALAAKRDSRNPFRRRHGYAHSCPELTGLLAHSGPDLYLNPLPWHS